jgi:hypothetical protein
MSACVHATARAIVALWLDCCEVLGAMHDVSVCSLHAPLSVAMLVDICRSVGLRMEMLLMPGWVAIGAIYVHPSYTYAWWCCIHNPLI